MQWDESDEKWDRKITEYISSQIQKDDPKTFSQSRNVRNCPWESGSLEVTKIRWRICFAAGPVGHHELGD